jgi:prepilin-type N-terminal cleavage/methylation domain-containing protein
MITRAGFTAWKAVPRAKPRRHRRQRAGWTLLELSIVVTISSIVFMLAAVTLAALFRVKVQMAGDTEQDVSIARLASRLRTDAHDAVSAEVENDCELKLADGRTIRYAASPSGVVREVARSGEIEHRDAFRLPRRAKVAFSSHDEERGQLVELAIAAADLPDQSYAIPARPIEILAAVNLHAQAAPVEAAK